MNAILLALIQQLNSAVFTLILVLFALFWALYRIGGYAEKFKSSEAERRELKDDVKDIRKDLFSIQAMTKLLYERGLPTVQKQSPVRLTSVGDEIAQSISAEAKLQAHWSDIKNQIDAREPQNPYDIQMVAMDIAAYCFERLFSEDEKNEIKTHAFRKGLNLLDVYPILGVLIRDRVLKERNIHLDEVDKHAPVKKAA